MSHPPALVCLLLLAVLSACGVASDATLENSAGAFQARAVELEAAAASAGEAAQAKAAAAHDRAQAASSAPTGTITPVDTDGGQ
ncbi:MAG TPA: hypothetical protein VNQ31_09710 [Sphingomonadaceae bacterium]|nr:hypothetical protein [Sphingomonadaceae bacterium]